jgi:hypothetical protein
MIQERFDGDEASAESGCELEHDLGPGMCNNLSPLSFLQFRLISGQTFAAGQDPMWTRFTTAGADQNQHFLLLRKNTIFSHFALIHQQHQL